MDVVAALVIEDSRALSEIRASVNQALGLSLELDLSGHYEELEAWVASILGLEVALLGNPDEPGAFQILVRSVFEASDHNLELDLTVHLVDLLQAAGMKCTPY